MSNGVNRARRDVPKNQAAFLLGLYLQTGTIECVFEPWLQICPVLAISKVLLLDTCMTRMRSIAHRAQALADEKEPAYVSQFDASVRVAASPSFQMRLLRLDARAELRILQDIAAQLWDGESRTRSWYIAGLKCGELVNQLSRSPEKGGPLYGLYLPQTSRLTGDDFEADKEKIAAVVRQTNGRRADEIADLRSAIMSLEPSTEQTDAISRIAASASCIADSRIGGESRADFRNQSIYEQIMHHGGSGDRLKDLVNDEREHAWPLVKTSSKLREYANAYALRNGLPEVPQASPGAPPTLRKSRGS